MIKKIFIILFWCSTVLLYAQNADFPDLKAEAAIAVDTETREILYAKDMDRRLYPASITKLLTAILLAENKDPGDILVYSARAKAVTPYKLDLKPGEELYAGDAMNALLLFSANDAAYMIAENIAGDVESFAVLMNEKAALLGLKNSHFLNPHGLHNDNHYSTAYDLSILLRQLYHYPWIMENICKKEDILITLQNNQFTIQNRNKLAQTGGCIAGKTGWTTEAGRNFAALYERNGRSIAAVVLKSEYDKEDTVVFRDMENLIDWAFQKLPDILFREKETINTTKVAYKLLPLIGPDKVIEIPAIVHQTIQEYTADPGLEIKVAIDQISAWNLDRKKSIGKLIIKGREIVHTYLLYPAISTLDIIKKEFLFYGFISALFIFLVACFFLLNKNLRAKKNR